MGAKSGSARFVTSGDPRCRPGVQSVGTEPWSLHVVDAEHRRLHAELAPELLARHGARPARRAGQPHRLHPAPATAMPVPGLDADRRQVLKVEGLLDVDVGERDAPAVVVRRRALVRVLLRRQVGELTSHRPATVARGELRERHLPAVREDPARRRADGVVGACRLGRVVRRRPGRPRCRRDPRPPASGPPARTPRTCGTPRPGREAPAGATRRTSRPRPPRGGTAPSAAR